MIIERFPEISALSSEEKLVLMYELFCELSEEPNGMRDPEIVAILEKRYEEYKANPTAVLTWEEVKAHFQYRS